MEAVVREAMGKVPDARGWVLLPSFGLSRLGRRSAAVLVTDGAVLVFAATRAEAQAGAVDLVDFHAGCRGMPVLPVVLGPGLCQRPLPLAGALPPVVCPPAGLPALLGFVARFPPIDGHDPVRWAGAPYRPAPGLMEAASALYSRHGDARIAMAGAERGALDATRQAVAGAVAAARDSGTRLVVFVTGDPGAGKTLCGLDTAFAPGSDAAFLTGNPALVHVLRGALARDAVAGGMSARAARQRVKAVVQPLHRFRDHHATHPEPPPDRVLVIDEAQRCWTAAHAARKTVNRPLRLHDSEAGLLLDAMARHPGWCAIICLVGGGQEIHAGEGGLAAWGAALLARPDWRALAPPGALHAADPRQRLPQWPGLRSDPALHLPGAVRNWRAPRMAAWADALLEGDAAEARAIAGPDLPVYLVRDLPAARARVRGPGTRRFGLVASAGARRLRAEGLGGLLWHQDEDAVVRWFLDTWPDIRSSDALEVAATEFGVQGLELDRVGVCWDLDLVPGRTGWDARAFRATEWTAVRDPYAASNKRNAYRVLLTRAREETTIWVPRGDARDRTRDPALYETVAEALLDCGARLLDDAALPAPEITVPEPVLL